MKIKREIRHEKKGMEKNNLLQNHNYFQIGITSYGGNNGCTTGSPDCFTDLPKYLDWIAAKSA